jgi:replication factor A1
MSQLTVGTCARLHHATSSEDEVFHTLHTVQFLTVKKVNPNSTTNNPTVDRYRIILSDGVNLVQAMLATQLNSLVYENKIGKHTVTVLEKVTLNYVQEKRYASQLSFL